MRWATCDGLTLDVVAPADPALTDTGDDVNENSIVLQLSYRARNGEAFRALFMGDAGEPSEARLLAQHVDLRSGL